MSTEEVTQGKPVRSDRLATELRMVFPSWAEPIGERPVEPLEGEVRRVAGRMGCEMEDARAVARHRRAIRALREAERTKDYRHVEALRGMIESGLLLREAMPETFGDRLNELLTRKRARGRPVRSIFRSLEIKRFFDGFRCADLATFDRFGGSNRQVKSQEERGARYSDVIQELAENYRTSPQSIEKNIQKAQESEHSAYSENLWEPDYDRFWRYALENATTHRVKPISRLGNLIT